MVDTPRTQRPRPPAARIILIALLCGAAVGLLQVSGRRLGPPVPALQEALGAPLLMADTEYKLALFLKDLAAWSGVPGVASPTDWEERAVAQFEMLALRSDPDPAACHRLAVIYAGRGYRQQARDMLMKAMAGDESGADVYLALSLVYSDDPIPPTDAARITQLLHRQPTWWALTTLEQLAHRLEAARIEKIYRAAALEELWRFGLSLGALTAAICGIIALSIAVLVVAGVRGLFNRYWGYGPTAIWAFGLPAASWLDISDVVAVVVFCNALGQVVRETFAGDLPHAAPLSLILRVLHYLCLVIPALLLVIRRAGLKWPPALGLRSTGLGRHLLQGLVALGATLFAVLLVQDLVAATFRAMVPGVWLAQFHGGGLSSAAAAPLTLTVKLALAVVLAPLVEEMVFRGYLFRALMQHVRPLYAAFLSAALFAGAHLPSAGSAFISLMILGAISAYTYHLTRSLIPSIILHAGYNACVLSTILVLGM